MSTAAPLQNTAAKPLPVSNPSHAGLLLQRKCACGGSAASLLGGECEECRNKRLGLQRRAANQTEPGEIPPIVHEVLHSSGQPLDAASRVFMEPRFGHDLSQVRVHSDAKAAESARSVNALAYTVGRNIVFGNGQYSPGTGDGKKLLAHELAHTLQQQQSRAGLPKSVVPAQNHTETMADSIAERIAAGHTLPQVNYGNSSGLMRKLKVEQPDQPIPNPTGQGLRQTNAETVEGYLRTLSPGGNVSVNRTSGEVSMATGFCPGLLGGLVQGARSGYRIGHTAGGGIPLLGPIFGGIGAIIGGLIGGIGGLFGANISAASSSSTPASSTCVCDFVHSSAETVIQINDQAATPAGAAALIRVPSPNSTRQWGTASASGRLETTEPWLILAHEMCGHAWQERHNPREEEGREENRAPLVTRDQGQFYISEHERGFEGPPRQARAGQYLRHGHTVERENLIRREHGIEARGWRLRDPYCGESFWRDRGVPNGPIHWQGAQEPDPTITYLDQCEFLRSQLPQSRNRRYRIDEQIPGE